MRRLITTLFTSALLFLSACGGGGGGATTNSTGNTNSVPTLSVSFLQKQLNFTWTPTAAATSYRLLHNLDGASGFEPVTAELTADVIAFTLSVSVSTLHRLQGRYLVQACTSEGCTSSNEVTPLSSPDDAATYLKGSNTQANDQFGYAIALSGDGSTLAIGSPEEASAATGINGDESDNSAPRAGTVYVFVKTTLGWTQQAYIKASNTDAGDEFGENIALSYDGHTLAVGARSERSNSVGVNGDQLDNSSIGGAGAVYVFARSGSTWTQEAYLKSPVASPPDPSNPNLVRRLEQFGYGVSLSGGGNVLAIGAYSDSDVAYRSGAVYVFERSGINWAQTAKIKTTNAAASDWFGIGVKISADGKTIVAGAPREDSGMGGIGADDLDNSAPDSGAVYVFVRNVESWQQQACIKALYPVSGHGFGGFGISITADGNILAVGHAQEASAATGINGDSSNSTRPDAGAVFIYVRNNDTWSQHAYLKASNTDAGDVFGATVAISEDGNTLVVGSADGSGAAGIGADQTDNSAPLAGAAYVFVRNGDQWSQRAFVKAPNVEADDQFGNVAISADATTLAIATMDDSVAAGIGGDSKNNEAEKAGGVFVY